MKLEGIHHITCITGDAPMNVEFYTDTMGLRLVKKSVNQDDPTIYHLFYADEQGSAGSDLTFFEYPGAARGRAGAGMLHTITWRVADGDALGFWEDRLRGRGVAVTKDDSALRFDDPEGLGLEIRVADTSDDPLIADHPDIPAAVALQGFDGARAYSANPERSRALLQDTLGFTSKGGDEYESRGDARGSLWGYDASNERGLQGAGTVHHIAWASQMDDHTTWRQRVADAGMNVTPVIDRFWFRSIYFREPSGVLFEIATLGPGFGVDEDMDHLGETLVLPPAFEHLRDEVEKVLTPLPPVRRGAQRT